MYRTRQRLVISVLLIAISAVGAWGCGSDEDVSPQKPTPPSIPALRFAGVDLIYALRRVAAEAGLLLALDEIQPGGVSPDLARFRIDTDLEGGPVQNALQELKRQTGSFYFKISDNVLYVRSQRSLDEKTGLDTRDLPGGTLKGDIEAIVKWIMQNRPNSFLKVKRVRGEPIFRVVEIDVPEKSSVLDLLLTYAEKADRGWHIRRAGQRTTDSQGRLAIIANTLALWPSLDEANPLPRFLKNDSIVASLASVSKRTGTPICVTDVSALGDFRGWLEFGQRADPQTPARQAVRAMAWGGEDTEDEIYSWEWLDGIIRVNSRLYEQRLPGQELLNGTLKGGHFEGTLPELARWLNRNRTAPSETFLMAGEITEQGPAASLEIARGKTVEDALLEFARASNAGWILVIVEDPPARQPGSTPPHAWTGAYLMPIGVRAP